MPGTPNAGAPGIQLRMLDVRLRQTDVCAFGWRQENSKSHSALISQLWLAGTELQIHEAKSCLHLFHQIFPFVNFSICYFQRFNHKKKLVLGQGVDHEKKLCQTQGLDRFGEMLMVSTTNSREFNFCNVKKLLSNLYLLGEQLVNQFYEVLDSE